MRVLYLELDFVCLFNCFYARMFLLCCIILLGVESGMSCNLRTASWLVGCVKVADCQSSFCVACIHENCDWTLATTQRRTVGYIWYRNSMGLAI
jgi:hypothetical protein